MKAKRSVFGVFLAACVLMALMPAAFATDEPAGADGIAAPENEAVPAEASDNMAEPAAVFQDGGDSAASLPATFAADDVIYISTLEDLENFRDSVNGGESYAGKTVVLMADIDLSEKYGEGKVSWTPIGDGSKKFAGVFDGNGKAITGLYIRNDSNDPGNDSSYHHRGLFGHLADGGVIKNLTVSGVVYATRWSGGICGECESGGSILNCRSAVNVIKPDNASFSESMGGVCGSNKGSIINCSGTGNVTGQKWAGGICGYNNGGGTVENCYQYGAVTGTDCVGGICGANIGTTKSCCYLQTGTVNATLNPVGSGSENCTDCGGKKEEDFASGEVAWLLQNGGNWGQELGTDSYPVLGGETVYQVTFQENGKDEIVRYCNSTGLSDLPEITPQDGYTAQWQKSDGTEFTAGTALSGDIVLTAAWTPNGDTSYTVKHCRQGLGGDYPAELTETEAKTGVTDGDTDAAARTYEGFTAGAVTQAKIAGDGSTVVEIRYTRNSYTLTFDPNGGTGVSESTVLYRAAVSAPAAPVRTGYTFLGWNTDSAAEAAGTLADTMPAGNITYYAVWQEAAHTDHAFGAEWKYDETGHWHECAVCGEKSDFGAHAMTWVVDREATAAEKGVRHRECALCGYRGAAEEIPVTASPQPEATAAPQPEATTAPRTGDGSAPGLWLALLVLATAGLTCASAHGRGKQKR